jgi:hypothetical protein
MQILAALGTVEVVGTGLLCLLRARPASSARLVLPPWHSVVRTLGRATRSPAPNPEPKHRAYPVTTPASVTESGRHHVPDELLSARTQRLTAGRVARARVHRIDVRARSSR